MRPNPVSEEKELHGSAQSNIAALRAAPNNFQVPYFRWPVKVGQFKRNIWLALVDLSCVLSAVYLSDDCKRKGCTLESATWLTP
jgi:hypothetical protein